MPSAIPRTMRRVRRRFRCRLFQAMRRLWSSMGAVLRPERPRDSPRRAARGPRRGRDARGRRPCRRGGGSRASPRRALGRVRHHDDRRPLRVDLLEEVHDLARHQRVEVPGRLVREDQARVAREDARDGDALLLAARELRGEVAQARGEPDELHGPLDPLLPLARPAGAGSGAARRRCRRRRGPGSG